MGKEQKYYDTFVTNEGSLDERINRSTGLGGKEELLGEMAKRRGNLAIDLLLENICSQDCISCYYQENGKESALKITNDLVENIKQAIQTLVPESPNLFTFYPREITTALQLLPIYSQLGSDRVLTNGKLLHKKGVIKSLQDAGINRMSLTVPGGKEAYSFYTGEPEDTYDHLLDNVSLAVRSGFDVSVFVPVFKNNVNDITTTVLNLSSRGVKEIQFLRVVPEGNAKNMADEMFLDREDTLKFLRILNATRHMVKDKMNLYLFKGYFGPNFYTTNVFRYLAGQLPGWPGSEYFCPAINRQLVCVSAGSHDVYNCFASLSFPEDFKVGNFENGVINYNKSPLTSNMLESNLRGYCNSRNCEELPICMGGCRLKPYSWAKRRNENDPLFAGQDFCITQVLREIRFN